MGSARDCPDPDKVYYLIAFTKHEMAYVRNKRLPHPLSFMSNFTLITTLGLKI